MIRVIEGYITGAKERKGGGATLVVDILSHNDERSNAENAEGGYGYCHAGYPGIHFQYPDPQLGSVYLLTYKMLEELADLDFQLTALKAHLGEEQVKSILKEANVT